MTSKHLDAETYRQLRSGTLAPARAREMAEHLDGDCATCEEFLAALPPDGLDGAVDATLTQVAPAAAEEQGSDLEYFRIKNRTTKRRASTSRFTRFAAMAAAVLAVGGVSLVAVQQARKPTAEWDGVKGRGANAVPARLLFRVVQGAGADQKLDYAARGATLPEDASLAFRVEVGRPAYVALLRVGSGESEVVWKRRIDRAGAIDIEEHGRPAAYPLKGLAGPQRFVLVASERPIADEDLGAAARAANGASASREDPRFNVMTLDVVEVTVR